MFDQVFEKHNFREKYPHHYLANEKEVTTTTLHDFNYISIAWKWHPEKIKWFNKAIQLLEGLIFTIKFRLKGNPPEGFFDFNMPPCETTWKNLDAKPEEWKRNVSLPVPKFITEDRLVHTRRVAQAKSEEKLAQVKYSKGKERHMIQILNVWAYNTSKRPINKLRSYAKKNWLVIKWDLQEVYLNDLRRTKPEKLETIIRFEVKKAKGK